MRVSPASVSALIALCASAALARDRSAQLASESRIKAEPIKCQDNLTPQRAQGRNSHSSSRDW